MGSERKCHQCGRTFDLNLDVAAYLWYLGHGCEVVTDENGGA